MIKVMTFYISSPWLFCAHTCSFKKILFHNFDWKELSNKKCRFKERHILGGSLIIKILKDFLFCNIMTCNSCFFKTENRFGWVLLPQIVKHLDWLSSVFGYEIHYQPAKNHAEDSTFHWKKISPCMPYLFNCGIDRFLQR